MKQDINIIPLVQGDQVAKLSEADLPDVLPILALRNAAIFPGTVFPITIGRDKSIRLIQDAEQHDFFIGAVPQIDVTVEEPSESDLYRYGTVCRILKTLEMPDGTLTAILQAFRRLEIEAINGYDPYITARVYYLHDQQYTADTTDIKAMSEAIKDKAMQVLRSTNLGTRESIGALKAIDTFEFLVKFVATPIDV
ncbi:MAG: LON peptidase substrate-binding domain-containing protein, partial [Bacteroidales bacterium]|nr:LON peptidase substrate-binding domain-containing protein [Bacteroidales bacterium]